MEASGCSRMLHQLGTWSRGQAMLLILTVSLKTRVTAFRQRLLSSVVVLYVCDQLRTVKRRLKNVPFINKLITAFNFITRKIWRIIVVIFYFLRPLLGYLTLALLSGSLLLNVYGFSTPWWIFIEDYNDSEPCYHVLGLWDTCILNVLRFIHLCEPSSRIEHEHAPSSYVNSCGKRSLNGISLASVRFLETLGVILATLAEIFMLQHFLSQPRSMVKTLCQHLPLALCLLAAGSVTLAGIYVCQKEIELNARSDDSMHMEWSLYASGTAGYLYIVTAVLAVLL